MPRKALDPAPRSYPPTVTLVRRAARGPAAAPERTTIAAIERWLLDDAVREDDILPLVESLFWQVAATGLPLDRATLHIGTLHPQLLGFSWSWNRIDGLCDETVVATASRDTDSFRRNPLYRVIAHRETVRGDLGDPEARARYPLLAELAGQGFTDYLAIPLGGAGYHNAVTAATCRRGGFAHNDLVELRRVLRLFALHVERHIAQRVAGNVLDTYLGAAAGGQVLKGAITRGSGSAIRAVIWVSDLRGYTDLSDRLSGPDVLALLDAYFERVAGAVLAHGGEVLKFIGDGLLAVFPFTTDAEGRAAAAASVAAAEQAMAEIGRLNAGPPPRLAAIEGWRPLASGIALHEGEVFFGNMGAPERLDFTVIGPAVNTASRVEALTKTLGRPVLVTAPVARRLDRPLDDLGAHPLRGVAQDVRLFALPAVAAP